MSADREELIGRTVAGKYAIESFVGGGAMGDVFKARQTALGKSVALKVLHRELSIYPELTARFTREALAASRLDHPGSIGVLDFGEEPDGLLYIAMEYVDGTDLQRLCIRSFPFEERRVIGIVSQALAAVAAAHDQGILHRDLKPENILVQAGTDDDGKAVDVVKVCDFGIAKIVESRSDPGAGPAAAPITATGLAVGTPEYMSPEQARGTPVDARSDVYSMGVVLYYLLTKTLPFQAETAVGVAVKHLFEEPKSPSERGARVSPALEAVCLKAMRKKPDERFPSARAMRAELLRVLDEGRSPSTSAMTVAQPPSQAPGEDLARAPTLAVELVDLSKGGEGAEGPVGAKTVATGGGASNRRQLAWAGAAAVVAAASVAWLLPWRSHTSDARPAVPAEVASTKETLTPPIPSQKPMETAPKTSPAPDPPAPVVEPRSAAPLAPPPPVTAHLVVPPQPVQPAAPSPDPPAPPSIVAPSPPPLPRAPVATDVPAPPPPAPPSPAPAPPAPIDPDLAKVSIASVSTTSGLPASSVRSTLGHGGFTQCYRNAIRAAGSAAGGTATLHLTIDDTGYVTSASAGGMGFLPGARACVEAAARGLRIPNVDTGEATADVSLVFAPR